ncbi:hypothetical protein E4P41_07885 [Geodermatophilus sp. DF01-2]|uniref:hypothetical protein n=1 Tax=Geodermatophilus sp. DF01-2 TaxID=2559610 RepID=UPI0010736946|nr:hypothetical protein [Geodermatophilus sp. DF01_2]TFV62275.1 hypothetical protein E4P41_07885 [Geodermatophilus sp. DF01_2]
MPDPDLGSSFGTGRRASGQATCSSYAAGHAVHPVRLQLSDGSPDDAWAPAVVMGAVGDVLTVACGTELRRYRNHDAGRVVDLVAAVGPDAMLNLRYGLLFLHAWPREPGSVFCLQPADEPPHPCR